MGVHIDEDALVFFEVMRWVYCNDASRDKDIVHEIMRIAHQHDIEDLVDHCRKGIEALEMLAHAKFESDDFDDNRGVADLVSDVNSTTVSSGRGPPVGKENLSVPPLADGMQKAPVAAISKPNIKAKDA